MGSICRSRLWLQLKVSGLAGSRFDLCKVLINCGHGFGNTVRAAVWGAKKRPNSLSKLKKSGVLVLIHAVQGSAQKSRRPLWNFN